MHRHHTPAIEEEASTFRCMERRDSMEPDGQLLPEWLSYSTVSSTSSALLQLMRWPSVCDHHRRRVEHDRHSRGTIPDLSVLFIVHYASSCGRLRPVDHARYGMGERRVDFSLASVNFRWGSGDGEHLGDFALGNLDEQYFSLRPEH